MRKRGWQMVEPTFSHSLSEFPPMFRVRIALLAAALLSPLPAAHAESTRQTSVAPQSPQQLMAGIERKHPAVFYMLAKKLFEAGEKDEAVFWFYAGQLRYRAYLQAN